MSVLEDTKLLKTILFTFILCVVLVIFSYFFLDRPLAIWFYEHNFQKVDAFQWLVYLPNLFVLISFTLVLFAFLFFSFKQLSKKFLKIIFAIGVSLYASLVLIKVLKIFFGRMGPQIWISHHFANTAYGFHWFRGLHKSLQDFPSGHSAAAFAVVSVLWIGYPKIRWLVLFVGSVILISLISTNNHYLGDCLAGAYLGALIGVLACYFFELHNAVSKEQK